MNATLDLFEPLIDNPAPLHIKRTASDLLLDTNRSGHEAPSLGPWPQIRHESNRHQNVVAFSLPFHHRQWSRLHTPTQTLGSGGRMERLLAVAQLQSAARAKEQDVGLEAAASPARYP